MRQSEVQVGGVYISKGKGMRRGKRVRLEAIKPQIEGPPRLTLTDLDGGKRTFPRADSFQQSYSVERLPHPIRNELEKVRVGGSNGHSPISSLIDARTRQLEKSASVRYQDEETGLFDLKGEMEELRGAFERFAEAVERRLGR